MGLTFSKETYLSADLNGESSLPPLADMSNVQNLTKSCLDEDDGLFIGYGFLSSSFPYKMQDMYDRTLKEREYLTATLENEYLKAVFLPDFGGRLWSLYDKKEGKELLYHNSVIRPCNLAVRNAWLAGGIEFNCGVIGHSPFTCSRLFTAEVQMPDGTPVLRMYEFERIRGIVYQMDFFLPDDSPVLFGRMRIVNPNSRVVPMYWWTNIAVPESEEYRNVFPAHDAYTNSNYVVSKVPVPISEGIDVTYPTNHPVAKDHFWHLPENARKFTSYINRAGYGFVQASTSRLKGRKLFVWGQGKGGARWQQFLTKDGCDGRYAEIQAGIGHTQYECIPMPPNTAWEWLECYGAIKADPEKIHGQWDGAIAEATKSLDAIISDETLEKMLKDTHDTAVSPAERLICEGSGWGNLENMRRTATGEKAICPHLDFSSSDKTAEDWIYLLKNGRFSDENIGALPSSFMLQPEWTALLEQSEAGYNKYIHLAAIYFVERRLDEAEEACNKALGISEGPIALFIMSQIRRLQGKIEEYAHLAVRVRELLPEDISVARMALTAALEAKLYGPIVDVYAALPERVALDGRVTMLYCFALLGLEKIDEAENTLYRDGGISVDDIREGEISITNLYIKIEEAKAKRDNRDFDAAKLSVPKQFEFRMSI